MQFFLNNDNEPLTFTLNEQNILIFVCLKKEMIITNESKYISKNTDPKLFYLVTQLRFQTMVCVIFVFACCVFDFTAIVCGFRMIDRFIRKVDNTLAVVFCRANEEFKSTALQNKRILKNCTIIEYKVF